jgi:hypothetical protein
MNGKMRLERSFTKQLSKGRWFMEPLESEEFGTIKLMPRTKIRSLCGTWSDLDIEAVTKEIIEDRKRER